MPHLGEEMSSITVVNNGLVGAVDGEATAVVDIKEAVHVTAVGKR